jgi:hypothetical protein
MISSRPEGLPKSPKPRLFKAESASNILRQFNILEKKHFTQGCAGLIVHALLTLYLGSLDFLQAGRDNVATAPMTITSPWKKPMKVTSVVIANSLMTHFR